MGLIFYSFIHVQVETTAMKAFTYSLIDQSFTLFYMKCCVTHHFYYEQNNYMITENFCKLDCFDAPVKIFVLTKWSSLQRK